MVALSFTKTGKALMEIRSTNARPVEREQHSKGSEDQKAVKTSGERNVMFDLGYGLSVRAMTSPQNENQFDSMDIGFVLQEQSIDNFFRHKHQRSIALAYKSQKPVVWLERDDLLDGLWLKYQRSGKIVVEYISYVAAAGEIYETAKVLIKDPMIY